MNLLVSSVELFYYQSKGICSQTLRRTRRWYARRKGLIEPVFGILKEQLRARRFLLRGFANVKAEFMMLATAFNLRILWRAWASHQSQEPAKLSLANPPATM